MWCCRAIITPPSGSRHSHSPPSTERHIRSPPSRTHRWHPPHCPRRNPHSSPSPWSARLEGGRGGRERDWMMCPRTVLNSLWVLPTAGSLSAMQASVQARLAALKSAAAGNSEVGCFVWWCVRRIQRCLIPAVSSSAAAGSAAGAHSRQEGPHGRRPGWGRNSSSGIRPPRPINR